jgi:hypothetical protein
VATVYLREITNVSRNEVKPYCLELALDLETGPKTYHLVDLHVILWLGLAIDTHEFFVRQSFKNDEELYGWQVR